MAVVGDAEARIKALERELRISKKQLEQSERDRVLLEDTKDKNDSLLREVIKELHSSQREIADKREALESTVEELKTTQGELIESAKMAALGELVAGVAHEVNTPLGIAVTAASHLDGIAKEFSDKLDGMPDKPEYADKFIEGSRQSSQIILNNLRRAAELIASFKLVAVDQSFNKMREFNVYEYLGEIILSLSNRLKRGHVTIEVEGDESLTIYADPGLLSQVITNLVVNALLHAYDAGDQGHLRISYYAEGEHMRMTFEDDGKGIPENHLGKVFDPFFTTKRGEGGSGLGLNIVYNVVRGQMRGKVRCESEVGVGTRFIMDIPLRQDEPLEQQAKSA